MSDDSVGGYEWEWECGDCNEHNNLSGMMGSPAIVNGEEYGRVRALGDGDTLECPNCGREVTINFNVDDGRPDDAPDGFEMVDLT